MGESFIESVPTQELNRIAEQANSGGEYEAARALVQRELARRAGIIEAMHSVDDAYLVPVDPMDDLNCESCE